MKKPPSINWPAPKLSGTQSNLLIFVLLDILLIGAVAALLLGAPWYVTSILAAGFVLLNYASFVEPKRLTVNTWSVPFPLRTPLRVAVASDIHVGPFKRGDWVEHVVHKISSLKPDLILLPGDFLFDERARMEDLDALKNLKASLGVFAVAGNHDAGNYFDQHGFFTKGDRTEELEKYLAERGIRMLRNRHVELTHGGETFALTGIDDLWGESCDLDAAFRDIPADMPVLFMTHHPDTVLDERSNRASVIVCGHTHGGQVRLPFIGPLGGVPSVTGKKYAYGLFPLNDGKTHLYTSKGCGETLLRVRFCCPPEIAVLELGTRN